MIEAGDSRTKMEVKMAINMVANMVVGGHAEGASSVRVHVMGYGHMEPTWQPRWPPIWP